MGSTQTPTKGHLKATSSLTTPDPLAADFRNFLFLVWKHLGLGAPTPIQYAIAYELQHGPSRLIIEAFRGCGKSWITVAYVAWRLYCNPKEERILVVSAGAAHAEAFTTFLLQLIRDVPQLQHLTPREDQRASTERFDVNGASPDVAPSVRSVGIFGQITGSRATCIVFDDIETPKTAETEAMRIKLWERAKEFEYVIKPDKQNGALKSRYRIVGLGTPQTENTIYSKLEEVGYKVFVIPALHLTAKEKEFYAGRLAPVVQDAAEELAGQPTEPQRFTREDLDGRKLVVGRSAFALQYMLDTRLSDAQRQPLKLSDLIVMDLPDVRKGPTFVAWSRDMKNCLPDLPNVGLQGDRYFKPSNLEQVQWEDYQGSVLAIDPSGRGADETAYAVVKHLAGFLYVPDAGGIQGGYSQDVLYKLASIAKAQQVNRILVEENFGQGMFANLLAPVLSKVGYPCTIELVRHNKQKEARIIDTLEPVVTGHRLVVDRTLIERDFKSVEEYDDPQTAHLYRLFYQFSRITRERKSLAHDDRLDVLAMAVGYWTDLFRQDQDAAARDIDEANLQASLRDFLEDAIYVGPSAGSTGRHYSGPLSRH